MKTVHNKGKDVSTLGKDKKLIKRGFKARLFHAILFEATAVVATSLFFVFIMKKNIWSMGLLSVMISLAATLWNGVFNYFFDKLQKRYMFSRTRNIRILHACAFEIGLIFITVPLVSFYLSVNLWQAFILEAGLILFFVPYTVFFNFIYDKIYIFFAEKREIRK